MKKRLENELIVAYTSDGNPLTKRAYNNRLKKAEKEILSGKIICQKDLEEEIKRW